MKKSFYLMCMAAFAIALSGCQTFEHASDIEHATDADGVRIGDALKRPIANPSQADQTVRYLDKQWVSLVPITETRVADVPQLNCSLKIVTDEPVSILEFSQVITKKCKIPVRVTPDALAAIYNRDLSNGETKAAPSVVNGLPVPALNTPNAPTGGNIALSGDHKIDVNYSGDLNGLLDMVSAREGIAWKSENNGRAVIIYGVDTRMFNIHLIATDTDMKSEFQSGTTQVNGVSGSGSSVSSGGGSTGGGSGSTNTMQTTVVSMKTSLWNDIQNDLNAIAPGPVNRVSISPSTGGITVRGTPSVLDAVAHYVDAKNKVFDKFVTFNVQVLSVTVTNTDAAGISWNALYKTLTGKYGISLASTFSAPAAAINGTFSILNTSGSPWGGTSAILSALNEQGKARLLRSTQLPTMNLNSVATQTGEQASYLASSSQTQTAQVGSTTTLQPGTINTGFNISMLPNVLDNNDILLRMNINLSSQKGQPRTVSSGGSTIELPDILLPLNTSNTIKVHAGDTVMLAGQDYDDQNSTRDGAGNDKFFLLGGGVNVTRSHTMLVVLITPVLASE
ncbi:PilN family type IVB pilus formation outer membrane protein (plasmid) [Paraburkholderia sprentiae WSM5005]|uniref:PilN family type IVB pilus formation outer membrane protein n=1 Tax=Paraburkholderia sprentiae WSM5005 TaxID=754502 RepID=A0ACA8AWZ4_9BURK|nr:MULTISPECIES: PilN family type IVB pilus formation outer membrane protein [Paraburkholderia]APA90236.2 PilN family type IVB pilus formation outer membrane protein [Paraburkholderia sprentiae WSM5005]TCK31765.1 type IVB pilus formation R64 PilN family outer membrane protein [Paraburkholderia sp. BL8N3]